MKSTDFRSEWVLRYWLYNDDIYNLWSWRELETKTSYFEQRTDFVCLNAFQAEWFKKSKGTEKIMLMHAYTVIIDNWTEELRIRSGYSARRIWKTL